ncbi:MAG: hypothetical protein OXI86_12000 [Candidatus Poribacteria bacterium]|nr:hypothetical protein [Candidatus Poribacteria bacterium]
MESSLPRSAVALAQSAATFVEMKTADREAIQTGRLILRILNWRYALPTGGSVAANNSSWALLFAELNRLADRGIIEKKVSV